jgi:pimeloyl-ACP methyl ester carboxylesterase
MGMKKNICSLVSMAIVAAGLSCCNNEGNKASETVKIDSMNTATLSNTVSHDKNIKTGVGTIHINDGGEGGVPVLFIHSFGGSIKHWENQLAYLRSKRRAIAMDLRGHGSSDPSADNDYSVESIAKDIATVADSLGLERFVIVGHSMGGSAAIAYAGHYPDRVAGLMMTGTPGKTPTEQARPIIASLESDQYEKVMEDYMKKLLANAKPATEKLEREGMNKLSKQASLAIIKAFFNYDPLPAVKNYPGPKMILSASGEDQPGSLHTTFPGIPYRKVEGTSHWIQLDKPGEFNQLLDEFLDEVASAEKK